MDTFSLHTRGSSTQCIVTVKYALIMGPFFLDNTTHWPIISFAHVLLLILLNHPPPLPFVARSFFPPPHAITTWHPTIYVCRSCFPVKTNSSLEFGNISFSTPPPHLNGSSVLWVAWKIVIRFVTQYAGFRQVLVNFHTVTSNDGQIPTIISVMTFLPSPCRSIPRIVVIAITIISHLPLFIVHLYLLVKDVLLLFVYLHTAKQQVNVTIRSSFTRIKALLRSG